MTNLFQHENMVVIEKEKRLSETIFWKMQDDYFITKGVNAWAQQVPFYITSNPFIANSYAQIIIRYIQDYVKKEAYKSDEPFYIIELGTGSGKFSFYTVKKLFDLKKSLGLDSVKVVYVMTDFTDANINYWKTQEQLKPFIDAGQLDFAEFNLETSTSMKLINENKVLEYGTVLNPLIVIANYIFDTISHDAFRVTNGVLQETLVKISSPEDNMQNGKPISMEKLVADYGHKNIMSDSYYPNKHINEILNYYAVGHKDINFLMPIGAMRAILSLMDISKNKLLLLSSDKAYSHAEELLNSDGPSFAFHGSFSLMVNLHAIGEFVKKFNGDVLHQSLRRGLKTSLFLIGQNLNDLPETKQAFMDYSDYYGPADYLNCHQMLKPLADTINMSTLASHLFFCRWDPYVLKFFCKKICENISTEPDSSRQTFIEGFEKAAELFYYSPGCDNMFFEIGYFFHIIKHYEKAINYYNQAIHYFGEQSSTLSNIGHCLYYMNKKVAALGQFEKALALTPDSKDIATWIETIRKDLGFEDEKSITTT